MEKNMSSQNLYEENAFVFVEKNNPWNVPNLFGEFTIENEHTKSLSLFQIIDEDNNVQYVIEFEKDTDNLTCIVNLNGQEVNRSTGTKTQYRETLEVIKDYVLDVFQQFLEEKHKEAMAASQSTADNTNNTP